MAKKVFSVPFQFCKLDRAVKLLNEVLDFTVEVDDLLNFAINEHIRIYCYNFASPVHNLSLSAKEFNILKKYFKFSSNDEYTYFNIGFEFEKRVFAVANDCAEFDGVSGIEDGRMDVNAHISGFWPILSWYIEDLYFNDSLRYNRVSYPIGGLLQLDMFSHFITVEQTLRLDSIVIFADELEKTYQHLSGISAFSKNLPNQEESLIKRSIESASIESRSSERATLRTSALIAALLDIIYQPNCELLQQSPKLYTDIQQKLANLSSKHLEYISTQRAFEALMVKVRQQVDKYEAKS